MKSKKFVVMQIIYLLGFSCMFYMSLAASVEKVAALKPLAGTNAKLTEEEVKEMEKKEGCISARPERKLQLHTTHSPNFLGLQQGVGLWKGSHYGEGVIIGVLDTGITPGHPSFSDKGVPAPPAKWKGKCDFKGTGCNDKLIGARSFDGGKTTGGPPVDAAGHGTHTSSTAAGNFVDGAGVFGMAKGTAAGMAPLAHLAMYQVCSEDGCYDSDIIAGIDTAVGDGVDVISISLGGGSAPFYGDSIALGAYGAIQKGIFVSCSAGNEGPDYSSLSNEAPWILTVGASTIDRNIRATAKLGNGEEYDGESLFQPKDFGSELFPLVYAAAHSNDSTAFCDVGTLSNVEGKVVVCELGGEVKRIAKGIEVKRAGGVAMILVNPDFGGDTTIADAHVLPATHLAPKVSFFSSRGPSIESPGILKPDIIGPGVSILAAWPFSVDNATEYKTFDIVSGTSMSCPHLSGIAALLKSSHPDWSPAAIKSAIMTTAEVDNLAGSAIIDETLNSANLFAIGADRHIAIITQKTVKCSEVGSIPEAQLNYPSFSLFLDPAGEPQNYTRTVTNVGPAKSTYELAVASPHKVDIRVQPEQLTFTEVGQTMTYHVVFTAQYDAGKDGITSQGYLSWVSDQHSVRSQISVIFDT
ncbi:hypothetical protein ACLB2K_051241 [Fragaria x ananassa]